MPGPPVPDTGGRIAKPLPPEHFTHHDTNAEMRWEAAGDQGYLVDTERFFVRNHTATPRIDADRWRLRVWGDGLRCARTEDEAVTLSYAALRRLPSASATAALTCAGNGRSFFGRQQSQGAEGTPWELGGIGVARWHGVPLGTVLEHVGVRPDAVSVLATGLDEPFVEDGVDHGPVRRPLPMEKALDDTLVAYEMNGAPLPPDHGFPARLVVPGWIGIASIKWLGSLQVSTTPLDSPWTTTFYRLQGGEHPADSPPITTGGIGSAFQLARGARLRAGERVVLRGRSWSGLAPIRSVAVSTDGGDTWSDARLNGPNEPGAWACWELDWRPQAPGRVELLARATDETGRTQPATEPWNRYGYYFSAVVRHPVEVG